MNEKSTATAERIAHHSKTPPEHPMWLPAAATDGLRGASIVVIGSGELFDTVRGEASAAGMRPHTEADEAPPGIVIAPRAESGRWAPATGPGVDGGLGAESFELVRSGGVTVALYGGPAGALYAWFHLVRLAATGGTVGDALTVHAPRHEIRMLDHWDNIDSHGHMGQVERGYSDGSIFYDAGAVRDDLGRVGRYARLLASIGVNRVAINNVNVGQRETLLLTEDLPWVARVAAEFRRWGIRTHLSINFASPIALGGLASADPLDPLVGEWWRVAFDRVYEAIPDFGGVLVKADSEGQPGPFAYGRDHADGANMLARAIAPHGGLVHWRAFVYNHHQDWRDRSTDRARAAFDHFTPLDGRFESNVRVQVKFGPLDFQTREPVSPVFAAMTETPLTLELQVTQEYTGQQLHAVYLAPQWREILDFEPHGAGEGRLSDFVRGGMAAVSNIGAGYYGTGHPLAAANLYAYGRLAWDPSLDPGDILDEWIALTFGRDETVGRVVHAVLDNSWATYEAHTAPLGVCFMVDPLRGHYGPSVDGYEYSRWGTYHFADRDGVGVDRTVATGTGYAGQYAEPWRSRFESLETVPDELVLFFHHVPYGHRLASGRTVIQHIYDTHFAGVEQVEAVVAAWDEVRGRVDDALFECVGERLSEQLRSAVEWRDQVNTYFWRKSGIPDEAGRTIY